MLVVRESPQKIELYLLAGRVGFIVCHAQKVLVIVFWLAVTKLLHMEAHAPAPHFGSVDVGHPVSHQRLQLWRSNHLSVHGDGQVVVPLHSD